MGRSYLSFRFVRLNCHLLSSCEVCFFGSSPEIKIWYWRHKRIGQNTMSRFVWFAVNSSCCIWLLVRICYQFLIHEQFPLTYVLCACSVSVGCCLGSTRFHVLFFTAVGSCSFVFSGFIRSFYLAHLFYYLWYQIYHLSIYVHWYPSIYSPTYYFLLIQKS
jgi:hypothetical protein